MDERDRNRDILVVDLKRGITVDNRFDYFGRYYVSCDEAGTREFLQRVPRYGK